MFLEETATEHLFRVSFIIWRPLWCGTSHLLLGAVGFPWLSKAEGSFEGEEAERVQSIYSSKKILKWASLLFSSRAVSHQSNREREEKGQIGSYVNVNEDQERCEGYNHCWTSGTVDTTSVSLVPSAIRSIRFMKALSWRMKMTQPLKHKRFKAIWLRITFDIHLERCSNILMVTIWNIKEIRWWLNFTWWKSCVHLSPWHGHC